MDSKELVYLLKIGIINENLEIYKGLFSDTLPSEIKDPYFIDAISFFNTLTDEHKRIFFSILRQVMIDSISNVLGVIDDSSSLEEHYGDFSLLYEGKSLEYLQDYFLSEFE
ncbi:MULTISPECIES: hypothetical protein [unclassified Acinetobacter]|uniref:hypothetical protein n=1 Tax=unclassified Acinetobacter TaxID=196816 RepID=UPI0015D3ED68|nr:MULTISPECIES: hypothetical protein [unclassified Acinetobacter]UUS64066.1 hypothetical protein MST18_09280 [Acinetobacter sp. YH12068_T]